MEIAQRIKKIIEYHNLSASTFADLVNVQRSSISHIISGRNKPSLDFVTKVADAFDDVDLYWLIKGKGNFPKRETTTPISSDENSNEQKKVVQKDQTLFDLEKKEASIPVSQNSLSEQEPEKKLNTRFSENDKKLVKVILFYDDGSFESFKQS